MKKTVAIVACAAAILMAGCGPRSISQTSPAPTSLTSASSSPVAVHCKLPVAGLRAGGAYTNAAGFVSIPDGKLVIDANGELVLDPARNLWHTVTKPVLYGSAVSGYSVTYDRPQSRWVPVPPSAVSPDGSRYAYAEYLVNDPSQVNRNTHIHVVDVATGTDRVVHSDGTFELARYADESIYLVHHVVGTDGSDGLWLLNPASGTVRQIGKDRQWEFVAAGSAWSADVDPNLAPPPQLAKFPTNRVLGLDLKTGTVAPWFSRAGKQVNVIGVDAGGRPFIQVGTESTTELWLASSPTSAEQLFTTSSGGVATAVGFWSAQPDTGGRVWLSSRNADGSSGISLYQPGSGLRPVADSAQLDAHGLGLHGASPAGPCIPSS